MSMVYADAVVLILKSIRWPRSTLMSVAKPCMSASPAPLMSQTDCGVPGWLFSHAMTLTGAAHGSVDAFAGVADTPPTDTNSDTTATPATRPVHRRAETLSEIRCRHGALMRSAP